MCLYNFRVCSDVKKKYKIQIVEGECNGSSKVINQQIIELNCKA